MSVANDSKIHIFSNHCQLSYHEGLGTRPLILITAKQDLYRKKDYAVNSKITKFGVERIDSKRFIAVSKYKKIPKKRMGYRQFCTSVRKPNIYLEIFLF